MGHTAHRRTLNRRSFIKGLTIAGAAGYAIPWSVLHGGTSARSRVAIVEHSGATTGNTINEPIVKSMVDGGVKSLAQVGDAETAWKALLPGVTSSSKIAIKVNTLYASLPTHPAVARAVASSLMEMRFGGNPFPANNIIIYDDNNSQLTSAGYTINTSTTGVRCFGTRIAGVGYSTQSYDVAGVAQKISKIVTEIADYIINLAVLKNHSMSGVTFCLKNHYGTCDGPGSLHNTYCSPYIAALNALAPIKTKQKVNIIDGLFGAYSGGPGATPQFASNRLFMSTDPVATDYHAKQFLIGKGCLSAGIAYHIDVAATTYGLGTNDPGQIDLVTVPLSTGIGSSSPLPSETILHQNYPNPFNPNTRVQFSLAREGKVELTVHDTGGRLVSTLIDGSLEPGNHSVIFDGTRLASGAYVVTLRTLGTTQSNTMLLLK